MDWSERKKTVQDIIERIVIYKTGEVEVKGHLPEFNQKVGYEPISRDIRIVVPTFEFLFKLNFRSRIKKD